MRVLVLSGTGFIGRHAVQQLAAMGHKIAVFHRGQTVAPLPPDVQQIYGDREQLAEFTDDFRNFAPEVVLDMLPRTEQEGQILVGVFTGLARRIVAISSGDVYRAYDRFLRADPGSPDPTPLTEDSPLRERLFPYRNKAQGPEDWLFHYEKILMERAVLSEADLPATILRLPMVYGPGDSQHRLFPYLKRIDDGRPAILLARNMAGWRGLYGYVEDMGAAIALCVVHSQAAGRIYHVAEASSITEAEWVRRIARAAGWSGDILALPEEQLPQHLRMPFDTSQDLSLNSSRIRKELGYTEMTPPDEAMLRTVAWERANPPDSIDASQFNYAAEDAAIATTLSSG